MSEAFRIIAIRTPRLPEGMPKEDREKALRIMKRIGEASSWLYFYNDYVDIDIDDDYAEKKIICEHEYSSLSRIYDLENIHIDVCAIVGKNGTGKSSLVDLLIRTINNVAAALVGEWYVHDAAEHLHYIENVYSDLCFELDDKFYIIEMRGRKVMMYTYSNSNAYDSNEYVKEDDDIYILDNKTNALTVIDEYDGLRNYVFEHFFYTLICNYSMYGFNYRDYIQEQTPQERLDKIIGKLSKEEKETRRIYEPLYEEDRIWLKGLFYKNDGYQTPIVIHPMRLEGIINVNRENRLAKERLLKIFFYKNSKGEYPLRTINRNLHVESIKLTPNDVDYGDLDSVAHRLKIKETYNLYIHYREIGEYIMEFWNGENGMKGKLEALPDDVRNAIQNYIVYKTIKIIRTYSQYKKLYALLRSSKPNKFKIKIGLRDVLCKDMSHRTRKLWRAIHFVTQGIYAGPQSVCRMDDISQKIDSAIEKCKQSKEGEMLSNLPYIGQVDLFLPPEIFKCDFILSKEDCDTIEFAHLSSGEKQIAYTIGSFLYHISNIDSEWYTKDSSLKYNYVNVVFDEIEQYYHPELQRSFLSYLLDGVACMDFKGLEGIHIMIVTHSPFVLSDIPRDNILVLRDDTDSHNAIPETYCGNINEMLALPFFMSYGIGEVARRKILGLMTLYKSVVEAHVIPENIKEQVDRYEYIVNLVGDKFIKMSLTEMMKEIKAQLNQ